MIPTIILNLAMAAILLYGGFYFAVWLLARYIMTTSEVDILAKIREIKKEAEDALNDY